VYSDAGRLAHIIVVMDDVTERKQVEAALVYAKERAEAGERAKGQFLAMMGHETRTPLNGIIGFTSLLLDTPLTPEQAEFVRTIRDSGEALLQLTNDVLDYSKIDAGRLSLEPQPCNVLECVEAAFELLAARAGEKHLELLHSVAPGVPAMVLADPGRLRQVLVNLVGNAVKFTAAGEIEVTVTADPLPPGGGTTAPGPAPAWQLIFAVRDTGIGIPAEALGRLFKPFSQVDSSSTRKYGGVGLGLAISRSLVQMMGGEISVQSEVGRGATFTFTIAAGGTPGEGGDAAAPDLVALRGRRVAVVGGSEAFHRELVALVGAWGARAVDCAREELAAAEWDTAVVDLAPAEAGGWRQLLAAQPELPGRPLVALIPADFPGAEREALRGSFRALVRKPVRHDALRALVAASLRPGHLTGLPFIAGSRSPDGLGLRVLLVEDNPVNQRLTQKMLENLGCHWDLAEDGRLALSRLGRSVYDLVLLDLHLPEVDGYAVVEQIRRGQAGERDRDIWIVALTADAQEAHRLRVMNSGISDCLTRPFKPTDLEHALRRAPRRTARPA
jgi:signal transduction histidine kinase/CheY-like chemotaxis protein